MFKMGADDIRKLMTLKEVSDYLRVTKKTIHRLLVKGAIPVTRVGHQWRFDIGDIDKWLKEKAIFVKSKILVIDDEDYIGTLFKETLEGRGNEVVLANSSSEGLKFVEEQDIGLVFLDLKMPGVDGAEVFKHIKSIKPKLPVIIITGYPQSSDMMMRALAYGPFGVMKKPFIELDIVNAVNYFLKTSDISREANTAT